VHSDDQLYMCGTRQCEDMFPKEKIYFFFNYLRDSAAGLRS
jgi:hypothetical protein